MRLQYDETESPSTRTGHKYNEVPDDLKKLSQWVRWRRDYRNGRWTKVPLDPRTGRNAASNDPQTWGTFEEAVNSHFGDGIGFVFTQDVGIIGIDLDHVIQGDEIEPWVEEILREIGSYTEYSPSGRGLHILAYGALPEAGRHKGQFECYDKGRFFTVTGNRLPGTSNIIEDRSAAILKVHRRIFGPVEDRCQGLSLNRTLCNPADDKIIEKASSAANGAKYSRLFNGEWQDEYPSQSEADAALCAILAFYTGQDASQLDRIFRRSRLMRPKWDERHYGNGATYGQETIARAIELQSNRLDVSVVAGDRRLPSINTGEGDLRVLAEQAWQALAAANNPPRFFRHGNVLARIERNDSGHPVFAELTVDRMRHHVARVAKWYKKSNQGSKPVPPPMDVVKDILATPDPSLPVVTRVVEAPVFSRNGSLEVTPGYCEDAQVYYCPSPGFRIADVPAYPGAADIERAKQLIMVELLGDFPFVAASDLAHAVALAIQTFARNLIDGATPLYLIEKPAPGTGGTLLAQVLFYPAAGHPIATMSEGRDEDEWRKRITAKLLGGADVILIDNVRRKLDSSALAAAITTATWEDRILGGSTMGRVPVNCAWVATGNNPSLSNEMARRTVRIRLDAKVDQPWMRQEFRHANLGEWVAQNRGDLTWACLVLVQAWISAGRPHPRNSPTLGQFEQWSTVLGGILDHAGIGGFLSNLAEFYDTSDAEGAALRRFVSLWWDKHFDHMVGVSDLWRLIDDADLEINVGHGNERSQKTRLGILLSRLRDRQFEGLRIVEGEERHGAKTWRLKNTLEGTW